MLAIIPLADKLFMITSLHIIYFFPILTAKAPLSLQCNITLLQCVTIYQGFWRWLASFSAAHKHNLHDKLKLSDFKLTAACKHLIRLTYPASLEVCSAAILRCVLQFPHLQGVSQVRKEPLSEWVPVPIWKPWALCLQGWQTVARCMKSTWKNVTEFDKRQMFY